jgi:protein-tyrosine phosphatase
MHHDLPFFDVHCHLLPGIDDGAKDWETSLAMARQAAAEGIGTIVATPHQLGRYEGNTREQILELTAEAQERIERAGLPLTILPGADVRIQENLPDLVRDGKVLTLADRRLHVLIELPHEHILPLGKLIHELRRQGIDCILSHPERNGQLQQNPELLRPWVQQGCLIQVTAGSITGHFGAEPRRLTRWLFGENMVHLVATDAHDPAHRPPLLRQAFKTVCRWAGLPQAELAFSRNPKAVVLGEAVAAPLPMSRPGVGSWLKSGLAACGFDAA